MELGLIGYPLSHSFSKRYFAEKFSEEGLTGYRYENYALPDLEKLPQLLRDHPSLRGLNVTIPHKQSVLQYMNSVDHEAAQIGAVNTIVVDPDGILRGYNSDIYGFEQSLKRFIPEDFKGQALVLGTGGASKAVGFVLGKMNIGFQSVSRKSSPLTLTYGELDQSILTTHALIVNTTPLGTYPQIHQVPALPYEFIGTDHFLYDLVYNPTTTAFMQRGLDRGAAVKNGYEMLVLQAERSWAIWHQ